jgi:hypothetical protein
LESTYSRGLFKAKTPNGFFREDQILSFTLANDNQKKNLKKIF